MSAPDADGSGARGQSQGLEMHDGGCRFNGAAASVRVEGSGAAVLAEPAAFKGGAAARVRLQGASIEGQTRGALTLDRPGRLEPLGMNPEGAAYDVTYAVAGRGAVIEVAAGGASGNIAADDTLGVQCRGDWCAIAWPYTAKTIAVEPAAGGPLTLNGRLPLYVGGPEEPGEAPPGVARVVVSGSRGDLVCGSRTQTLDGQTQTWQVGPHGDLAVEPVELAGGALRVTVSGERAPAVAGGAGGLDMGGMPVAVGAVVAAVVGAWAVRAWWHARVRADVPGQQTAPGAEPENALAAKPETAPEAEPGMSPADDLVTPPEGGALAKWQKKLAFLELRRAQTANAAQQFELDEQIAEAKQKILEFDGH